MHFFNKDLFPLLNKHSIKDIEQDYFDFNTVMKETEIIKSVSYNNAYKKACQIFIEGISLCLDIILSNKKDKNINELNELNKKRENFVKDVLILFRFEKVINEYYQKYKKDQFIINDDKFDFFEPKDFLSRVLFLPVIKMTSFLTIKNFILKILLQIMKKIIILK